MSERGPLLAALRPVPGALRLVALRLLVQVLASLPAVLVGVAQAASAARNPHFTDLDGRLPIVHLTQLVGTAAGPLAAALAIAAVLYLLADQLLTAGALAWLAPDRPPERRVSRIVAREGLPYFYAMLRILLVALIVLVLGRFAIVAGFERLEIVGARASWSGRTMVLLLPLFKLVSLLLWFALVGAWVLWCRVLTVADGRRRVRRTALLVLGLWRRHPLRAPMFFVGVTLALLVLSAVPLVIWRQHPPRGLALAGWWTLWPLVLALEAYVWYWLLRAARLLYAGERARPVREAEDAPLRPFAWIGELRRRLRHRPG